MGAGAWTALALAAALTPDPTGAGTHEQLGLPPCAFLARTGWPCPTCGLTTSVAAATRGHVVLAFQAHPFGLLLVAAMAALGAAGTIEALTGRKALGRLRPGRGGAWAAVIALPAGWVLKILMGLAAGTLPMR